MLGPVDVALSLSPIERGQFRIKVNKDRGYRFPERLAMRLIGDPPHDPLALEIFDAEAGPAANRRAENIARIDEHLGQHAEESPSVIVKACGIRKSEGLALIRELVEDGHYVERSEGRGKMVALPDTFDEGDGDLFQ